MINNMYYFIEDLSAPRFWYPQSGEGRWLTSDSKQWLYFMALFYLPARNACFKYKTNFPFREGDNQKNYTSRYVYLIRFMHFGVSQRE